MKNSKRLCICFLLISLFIRSSVAQDDLPVVGIVKIGSVSAIDTAEQGILDVFEAYGYEDGVNVEIRRVDAAGDVQQLAPIVEVLISEDVDLIIPLQAQTISATLTITEQLENPPAVIFSVIQDPYAIGLAEDACSKPAYATGQTSGGTSLPMISLFEGMREFAPDLTSIAYVYNSNDSGAALIAEIVESLAEEYDFTMMSQAVASGDEVVPVLETLLISGAESILIFDVTAGQYISQLSELSIQAQVPIFTVDPGSIYLGATMGVGTNFYEIGANAGRMAAAYLEGELDLATTGISEEVSILRAANLDVALGQGQIVPETFVDTLDYFIDSGQSTEEEPSLGDLSEDEMRAADAEFIASLQCPREPEATEAAQ